MRNMDDLDIIMIIYSGFSSIISFWLLLAIFGSMRLLNVKQGSFKVSVCSEHYHAMGCQEMQSILLQRFHGLRCAGIIID